jgi:hypothetical protein
MQLDLNLKTFKRLILSLAKYFQSANNVYKEFMNLLLQLDKLKEGVLFFIISNFKKCNNFCQILTQELDLAIGTRPDTKLFQILDLEL